MSAVEKATDVLGPALDNWAALLGDAPIVEWLERGGEPAYLAQALADAGLLRIAPEFDHWLAAHDEQVRRDAQVAILRDRADWVENGTRVSYPHMELADWLRRCAARIDRTEPTDG